MGTIIDFNFTKYKVMDNQEQVQIGEGQGSAEASHRWGLVALAVAIFLVGAASFFAFQKIALSNADYICTHIVEENEPCGNGSWGSWYTVASSTSGGNCSITTTTQERLYTGTRTTRHILQYLNLRTACQEGYTTQGNGDALGDSGFHGGTTISETAVCQIRETRTTSETANTAACSGVVVPDETLTSVTTDISSSSTSGAVSSIDQLNAFRAEQIDARISAIPSLVQRGATTIVRWQTVEMTSCTVVGENGDSWTGIAGEQRSGIINEKTTFTLNCTAFNGTQVTEKAEVNILPVWKEN